jgi:diacylglycerol kinase family enzyme
MLIPMNIRAALDVIDTGKPMPFDIGYIPEYDAYFVFVAGAGYDATLIRETPFHLKKKIGFAAYVATGIKHASAVQPVRMDLELDGKVRHLRAHTVMAVNIGTISNVGFSFAPDVDPHDGKLNIEIMSTRSLAGSLFIVLKILIKRYHGFAALKHEKASRIRVTSDPPFPVEIDGDHIGTTPFSAEVIPGGMTFLVPQNYTKDTYKHAMDPLAPLVADFKAEVDARLRGTRQKND